MTLNIHQKINFRALAKEFPIIAKKEFHQRFRKLRIGSTGALEKEMAFRGKVLVNGVVIEMDYLYYGIFTAMAVGKGITKADKGIARLIGSGRRAKPWTKGIAHMKHRLGELYTDIVAEEISQHVNQSYDRTIRMRF